MGNEEQIAALTRRVWLLEQQLREIEIRMELEKAAQVGPTPPPFDLTPVPPAPPPTTQPVYVAPPVVSPAPESPVAAPSRSADQTEYMIGARLLPKVGAAMVVLAVLFFVIWGYSSGWITPKMVFAGEALFCLAFIGIGLWKREEKEEFGQILTAIGSCGLYLTFAGGHVYYNLYSSENLVAQFLLLSLANLGFSLWRSSRSFLALGFLGGLAAALLPLQKDNASLNAALHLLIVFPSLFIAAKNRWFTAVCLMWPASLLALVPLLTSTHMIWQWQVTALFLSTVGCMLAYGLAFEESDWDSQRAFAPVALFATGGIAIALHADRLATIPLLLLGLACAGLANACPKVRNQFLFCAFAIPMTLCPAMLDPVLGAWLYIAVGAAAAMASFRYAAIPAAVLSGVELALGIGAYLLSTLDKNHGIGAHEAPLLIGLIALAGIATIAARRIAWAEEFAASFLVVALPLTLRLGMVLFAKTPFDVGDFAIAFTGLIFAYAALALWLVLGGSKLRACAWGAFAIAAVLYLLAAGGSIPLPRWHEAALLVGLMANLRVLATAGSAGFKNEDASVVFLALLMPLFLRFGVVSLQTTFLDKGYFAAAFSSLIFAYFAWAFARRTGSDRLFLCSWISLAITALIYAGNLEQFGMRRSYEAPLITGMAVLIWLLAREGAQFGAKDEGALWAKESGKAAAALMQGAYWSRLLYLFLSWHRVGLSMEASAVAATALFASGAAILSLRKQLGYLLLSIWTYVLISCLIYLGVTAGTALGLHEDLLAMTLALTAACLATAVSRSNSGWQEEYWYLTGILVMALFTRWFYDLVLITNIELASSAAVTLAWVLFAVAALSMGFVLKTRPLRYLSFAVLGLTAVKVVGYDLAATEAPVRVAVLLSLGIAMLGGGYWYIRWQSREE